METTSNILTNGNYRKIYNETIPEPQTYIAGAIKLYNITFKMWRKNEKINSFLIRQGNDRHGRYDRKSVANKKKT